MSLNFASADGPTALVATTVNSVVGRIVGAVPMIEHVEEFSVAQLGSGVVLYLIMQPVTGVPRVVILVGTIENGVPNDVVTEAGIVRIGGLAETDKVT